MANHNPDRAPEVHMCLGSADFVVFEGDLAQAPTLVLLPHVVTLDVVVETLMGLRLHLPKIHTLERGRLNNSGLGRPEQWLDWEPLFPKKLPWGTSAAPPNGSQETTNRNKRPTMQPALPRRMSDEFNGLVGHLAHSIPNFPLTDWEPLSDPGNCPHERNAES